MEKKKVNLFISYAHQDKEPYLRELETFINDKNCPNINVWYDKEIRAGAEWDDAINEKLMNSEIVLLLISPYFMLSKYINDYELKISMERQRAGKCIAIPIFIRHCVLDNEKDIDIFKRQGLPNGMKFISDMGDERFAHYTEMTKKINETANEIITRWNVNSAQQKIDLGRLKTPGEPASASIPEKIKHWQSSKKIFLSLPDSEEGRKKRKSFLFQVEGKIKHEDWPYEIVPGLSDAEELYKMNEDARTQALSSLIKDSIYAIHIISSADDLRGGTNKTQYEISKNNLSNFCLYKVIIWVLNAEIKNNLDKEIMMNPVKSDYDGIFDVISDLDNERQKKLDDLLEPFSPGKKIFMFYDFVKDHANKFRINIKSMIESDKSLLLDGSLPGENLKNEKESLEKCDGGLIYYGTADPQWFIMRQALLFEANRIKAKAIYVDEPNIEEKVERDIYNNYSQIIIIKGPGELQMGMKNFMDRILK